jgi:DNA-binding NarL/FixJ family response regulator
MLSQHASPTYAATLLGGTTNGIGYLLKDRVSDVHQIAGALRTVATGGSVVDPLVVQELIAARRVLADSPLGALTEREQEVLAAMAEGLSNAAIATRTYSSERTVEKHIATIFTKLELANEPDTNRRVKAVLVYLTELSR